MTNTEELLYEFLLIPRTYEEETEKLEAETKNFNELLTCTENWNNFFEHSFDNNQTKTFFNNIDEEEKQNYFKFGLACITYFVQGNFTGPNLPKEIDNYFNSHKFETSKFSKLLSVNNEDININTKYPVLLVTAKLIFEHCVINETVNDWWNWRVIWVHQQILEDLSPSLLSEADRLYKQFHINPELNKYIKSALDVEVAQLYLTFRQISRAKEHILMALEMLGIRYDLLGALGKRTRYQEKELAQLALKVTVEEEREEDETINIEENDLPKDIPIGDDVLLNSIDFLEDLGIKCKLGRLEQKLFVTIVSDMIISKPQDGLQKEQMMPFIDLVLSQKNTFTIKIACLLMRCKLETKNSKILERALKQSEEILQCLNKEKPPPLSRIIDAFGTGMPPIWKIEMQYANILISLGLVRSALITYTKLKLWEEVIICYTFLQLKHKAAEVIQEQIDQNPTPKLFCLLGDATDDVSCYEKAWELSKRRSHRAQRHWGKYLFSHKKYEECIPHFEKALSINPLHPPTWFRLGYAALKIENWQTAATAYRRYTCFEPECFIAWNNLAQACIKIGNKRGAHQAILEALKCNYDNWKVWENLLVISCDISNFSEVIRAYHRLLDLQEKYLNVEVLNVLVYNVCNDINDSEGQTAHRFLQKTRELLGRVTSLYPTEGYIWELYANLSPSILLKAQRLQRAYRGYTQGSWDKNPTTCQQVLYVCVKLAEIVLDDDMDPRDTIVNSVKLNLSSAIAAVKKQDFEETRDLVGQVSVHLDKIVQKLKNDGAKSNS
ncbi:tetratricopeptide repeat protein 27 [Diorhabda carinulata]|uniref:tetratricopeptide repeat protein 27 n=1 Tax=Diorhabda carinulata TaxID=1163345 RepID=UPI0025A0D88B|nr:tetratricopeptide repeat protein 27 [Diorhabda carinulata]